MTVSEGMQGGRARNYFDLFRIPTCFDLDVKDLGNRYRTLQQQFHPDRFSDGSDADRRVAAQMSADINAGFQILSDPTSRAGFLLQCEGFDLQALEKQAPSGEFLMQQMELREQLQSIPPGQSDAHNQLSAESRQLFDSQVGIFRDAYTQGEFDRAGTAWVHLLYLKKLREEVERRENSQ